MGSVFPTANGFSLAVTFYCMSRGRKATVHAKSSKIHNAGRSDGRYIVNMSSGTCGQ
jgi:hypothetical protein